MNYGDNTAALRLALVGHLAGRGIGPVKWCKRCSRRHGSRETCDLTRNDRGRYVHAATRKKAP